MRRINVMLGALGNEFSREMAYKTNFIIKLIALMTADFVGPIITAVIYASTAGVPGWSFEEFLLLQGIFIFVLGIMHFAQIKIASRTIHEVREGTFDKFLTKPFKPLTYISLTSWEPEGLGEAFVGLVIMIYTIIVLQINLISLNFIFFIAIIALALLFTYSFIVIIAALSFLFVKSFGIFNIFFQVMDMARYPASIYSYGMRFFVSFLIPVTVTATVPAIALIEGYSLNELLWTAFPVFLFFLVSMGIWTLAMRKYTSAGG